MFLFNLIRQRIINFFASDQDISEEALLAYAQKLPKNIEVEWNRDGKFIIGRVVAEGSEYMTQAVSTEEFIEMVNDGLLSVYKIPVRYFRFLKDMHFRPPEAEIAKLNNRSITTSVISFNQKPVVG